MFIHILIFVVHSFVHRVTLLLLNIFSFIILKSKDFFSLYSYLVILFDNEKRCGHLDQSMLLCRFLWSGTSDSSDVSDYIIDDYIV